MTLNGVVRPFEDQLRHLRLIQSAAKCRPDNLFSERNAIWPYSKTLPKSSPQNLTHPTFSLVDSRNDARLSRQQLNAVDSIQCWHIESVPGSNPQCANEWLLLVVVREIGNSLCRQLFMCFEVVPSFPLCYCTRNICDTLHTAGRRFNLFHVPFCVPVFFAFIRQQCCHQVSNLVFAFALLEINECRSAFNHNCSFWMFVKLMLFVQAS